MRSVYAAWAAGAREKAFGFFDPEVTIDATRRVLNPDTYVGIEGLGRMLTDTGEVWAHFRFKPIEFIDAGARVVVIGRLFGKGRGSGIEVNQPIVHYRRGSIISRHDTTTRMDT